MFLMTEPVRADAATGRPEMSFRDVVETHKRVVYYLALDLTGNHHDAEDLSQDVFIKAYRGLEGFRGDAQMYTWLRRITVNTYLNNNRKKVLDFFRLFEREDQADQSPAQQPGPDVPADSSILRQHLERALDVLSARERAAFVLRHYDEMPVKEIAASMGIAGGTVKSLLFRATQKLQKKLAPLRAERE